MGQDSCDVVVPISLNESKSPVPFSDRPLRTRQILSASSWEDQTMAFTANKVEMWTGEINDRIGGLAAVLEPLAEAGVDLEVVVARRQPGMPGKGVVFLGPIKGAKGEQAAAKAGLKKTPDLTALRVDG